MTASHEPDRGCVLASSKPARAVGAGLFVSLMVALTFNLAGASTINPSNRFAYGANIGWVNWRGDVTNGAVIGEFICSGYLYSASVGWIHLGGGVPSDGIRYRNNSARDYGVNHDGRGNLRGYAWGANIGWLTFTNRDAIGASYDGPKVDLRNGRLRGFAWSGNCGWMSLSNTFAQVQTDTIRAGPDHDRDGIPDNWELSHAGNVTLLNADGDNDGDGVSDAGEYLADTDPFDPNSLLRITRHEVSRAESSATLTWTSQPSRLYRIQRHGAFGAGMPWQYVGPGVISPGGGPTTSHTFIDHLSSHRFFRIEPVKPLAR